MSQGIDEAGFLKFDMKFMGTENKSSWGYNSYKLVQGEAQFENLYKFVFFLENGRRLYKISSMKLEQKEAIDPDTKDLSKWIIDNYKDVKNLLVWLGGNLRLRWRYMLSLCAIFRNLVHH